MFRKNFLKIFLIIAAVAQVTFAKPTPDTDASVTATTPQKDLCKYHTVYKAIGTSSHDKDLPASAQLLRITVAGLMSSAVNYAEKAKPIADAILKDSELLSHIDQDEVKSFKQKLETFVKAYTDCNSGKELFKLVELFSDSTSEFYDQAEEDQKLSPQGKMILKLLKHYKVEQIEQEFTADIKKLITEFEEKYAQVKDDLEKEQKDGIGEKIIKWHEQFSTLKDYDDQIEALYEFFNFFDLN